MGDIFQRHSFKITFKLKVKSVRGHILIFDIFENRIASLGSYEDLSIGAGAGAAEKFYFTRSRSRSRNTSSEPEPEPEPPKNVTAPHT